MKVTSVALQVIMGSCLFSLRNFTFLYGRRHILQLCNYKKLKIVKNCKKKIKKNVETYTCSRNEMYVTSSSF